MQFSVPQFTEVEDKIIGPLTMKQFGIVFGAGILVFLSFSLTKSVFVLIVISLLVGFPALGIAFAKPNGRPMYNMLGNYVSFFTSPKIMVFHKEGSLVSDKESPEDRQKRDDVVLVAEVPAVDPRQRIKEINRILEQKAKEEKELFNK
jgi:hypothetical protein